MIKTLILGLILVKAQEKCDNDSDCLELNSCNDEVCKHKGLFPLATSEIVGIFVMITVSTLANAGGIGGSVMTLSLMLLLHKFDPHSSVAMTHIFMFAGAFTATLLKIRDRHPTRDRPLIYYDILMQIVSPILIGVSVGVTLNPAFPGWLILALLTIIVAFIVIDVFKRGLKIYRNEKNTETSMQSQPTDVKSENTKNLTSEASLKVLETERNRLDADYPKDSSDNEDQEEENDEKLEEKAPENGLNIASSARNSEEGLISGPIMEKDSGTKLSPELLMSLEAIYAEEKKIISWMPLSYFILLTGASIMFPLLKGSSAIKSIIGVKPCSPGYFGVTVGYIIFMFLMNFASSIYLVRKTSICEKTNYLFDQGDIHWTYKKCLAISICSLLAGIVVGLLGLGGGTLIGPLLLYLGIRPEISTMSSLFIITISTGTASAQYFISGIISLEYSGWFFLLSIIGSLLGILALRRVALKKKKVSVLVFSLFIILLASLVIIPTVGVINSVKQSRNGNFQLGFKRIC